MRIDTTDARLCWRLPPEFLFTPEALDFGCLPQNAKAVRELYVRNLTGPIDACSVLCAEDSGWLRVLCLQSVGGYEQACLRLTVEVDTSLLLPGRSHAGWMEVRLDECCHPIQVAVEVVAARMALLERWRLARTLLAPLLAVVLISGLLSRHPTIITKSVAAQLLPTLLALRSEIAPNLRAFSAYPGQHTTQQFNAVTRSGQERWGVTEWSPDGRQLLFISDQRGALQHDPLPATGGIPLQMTSMVEPKFVAAWSPTGKHLAFLAPQHTVTRAGGAVQTQPIELALWLVDRKDGQETLVSTDCVAFAWSPDGRWLAYVTGDPQAASPLFDLWLIAPGATPTLLAQIDTPTIAWKPINNY